jgi:hypothetical protein
VFLKSPCNEIETGLLIWILEGGWGGGGRFRGEKGVGAGTRQPKFLRRSSVYVHHLCTILTVKNNSEITHLLKICFIKMVKFPENLT